MAKLSCFFMVVGRKKIYKGENEPSKSQSSSQVIPSKSRRFWWKLFIWSHRNLNKPWTEKSRSLTISHTLNNQQGVYSLDTLEPNRATELGKLQLPGSFMRESRNKSRINNNQWLTAFSTESSSLARVDEWVNILETQSPLQINEEDTGDHKSILFPPSPETGESSSRTRRSNFNISAEVLHANSVIQPLSSSSTVAHIKGMGLKVIPTINSRFSNLRSIDLSGNFIGSLPKRLHTLNLSRNKIVAIEGLRELTRLRVLNLSYNWISRIGRGLSSCMLIKELYLAGNKISDVEGVHRLLKLTVLDLSFNKITTAKTLSQLAANYNSLLALNLVGNPIQKNICEEQLRKAVSGILPQLVYLNKQPINPQRAREVAMNSVAAKAALGNNGWRSHRKRVSSGRSSFSGGHRSSVNGGQKRRDRAKSRSHEHHSHMDWRSSTVASSSNSSSISKIVANLDASRALTIINNTKGKSDLPDSNQRPKDGFQDIFLLQSSALPTELRSDAESCASL